MMKSQKMIPNAIPLSATPFKKDKRIIYKYKYKYKYKNNVILLLKV